MDLHLALDHAPILSIALMILSTLTCSFPGRELVWLNTQGRAQQRLEGRADEGGGSQPGCCPLSSGSALARALPLLAGDTRREKSRKGGAGWSLHNVKHGVGGGFV